MAVGLAAALIRTQSGFKNGRCANRQSSRRSRRRIRRLERRLPPPGTVRMIHTRRQLVAPASGSVAINDWRLLWKYHGTAVYEPFTTERNEEINQRVDVTIGDM